MRWETHLPNGPPASPRENVTIGSLLGVLLGMAALFAALASPLFAAVAVVGLLTIGKLLQVGLAAAVRRTRNRVREISIPGVGTVRFRVVPR